MINPYQRILVLVDGSKSTNSVFQRALEIAQTHHAQLHLVSIINPRTLNDLTTDHVTTKIKKILDKDQQIAQSYRVITDYSIEYGSPKTILAYQMPKRWDLDLIIIGGSRAADRTGKNIGSYVSKIAPCDVLWVKK